MSAPTKVHGSDKVKIFMDNNDILEYAKKNTILKIKKRLIVDPIYNSGYQVFDVSYHLDCNKNKYVIP